MTAAFASAAVVAMALLAGALGSAASDRDWHAAVTIGGAAVGRADFRNRAAVLAVVADAQAAVIEDAWLTGAATAAERDVLTAATALSDPVTATVDDLVRERAIRMAAAAAGITAGAVDPWAELARAAVAPLSGHVRWLSAAASTTPGTASPAWPAAPAWDAVTPASTAAWWAAARRAAGLLPTTPVAGIAAAAEGAGWSITGGDAWLPDRGPVPGIPDVLVGALRSAGAVGTVIGPIDDGSGSLLAGVVTGPGPAPDVAAAHEAADRAASVEATSAPWPGYTGADESWLRVWAETRVLERQLEAAKVAAWTSEPARAATVREVVVGSNDITGGAGPFAGLAHLVVGRLPADMLPDGYGHPGESAVTPAEALAAGLRALPVAERLARWDALVAAANASGPEGDAMSRSGEMGWLDGASVVQPLGVLATREGAVPGTVVGPITTAAGPEVFLVRGVYPGTLDEHDRAVLAQVSTAVDLGGLAARISPWAAPGRYATPVMRFEAETFGNASARLALFEDPLADGTAGRPYLLAGQVVVPVVVARGSGVPSGLAADRVRTSAFAAWIGEEMAAFAVTVDADPFGRADAAIPAASAVPSAPDVIVMPTPPSAGLP